jgi:hypothetical protein
LRAISGSAPWSRPTSLFRLIAIRRPCRIDELRQTDCRCVAGTRVHRYAEIQDHRGFVTPEASHPRKNTMRNALRDHPDPAWPGDHHHA